MTPRELVPKYIVNREGVLSDPQAFEALSDFGRSSDDTKEALASGIKYLGDQFYGRNLLLMATPEGSGNLQLQHTSSTLPLDGQDAYLIERRSIDNFRGILSRSFLSNRDELVRGDLHEDRDYLEFSKSAAAVYSAPIRSGGKVLGVFCIDSSDPRNFKDTRIMPMIHNFVELLMISLINSREEKAKAVHDSQADLMELERKRLKAQYATALAATWPLSPALLQIMLDGPCALRGLEECFPGEDVLEALHPLSRADLVEYRNALYSLSAVGERLANVLRHLISTN